MTDSLSTSGLVVVDKPAGMTSHDVVSRLRKYFSTRKIGHAGTLDPMATGVLVAGIERGTRFLAHLVLATKSYDAVIRLGQSTDTDDADGDLTGGAPAAGLADEQILAAVAALTGEIMQRPASVSAIKIDGRRAHQRVRDGEEVELPARPVTVSRFDVHEITRRGELIDVRVSVDCSSGTYIRSLGRDLGESLGVGGHLIELRRTAVGPFSLDDALTLAELETRPRLSLPLDEALPRTYPTLAVTDEEADALSMGKWLQPRGVKGVHAAIAPDGRAIALVREKGKRLSTVFVARPNTL
ncbi:tRNA pseudouridine(55) synthase TruB [Corynebacterium sp.]|uniref:tRNA pseudouridine(55) synthase TruB n=1 Tax=Corynebacterium sp. TaxID=1720 RepID=UPI00373631E9